MNPTYTNEQASYNLPPPHTELPARQQDSEGLVRPAEISRNGAEMYPGARQPIQSVILPVPPSFGATTPANGTGSDDSNTTNSVVTTTADDGDLIEKEWVNKAKAIVEKTHNDPYQQSKELNYLRAGYMQERYSKHIKLSE